MWKRFFKKKDSVLDDAIERLLAEMKMYGPDAEDYLNWMESLERLYRLREQESHRRVSPDTLAIVLGNLFGILVIVAYEQKHVMVSKGLGQILRPRSGIQS